MFPKPMYSLAAALLAVPMVHGHYIFSQLLVNGAAVGGDYEYIRKNTNTYMPSFTDDVINSEDLRCNQGALSAKASTMEVKAGDTIGAKLSFNEFIEHPGPGMIYMSKAPSSVADYMGDGYWFKIWESGPDNGPANVDTSWGTWQKDSMSATIPADIPDGEYLVRFEHVAIHENHVGKSQFYMECAQVSVSGGGSGSPSPVAKIPGLYTAQDPAFTYSIWDGTDPGYTMPGPAVWGGGGSSGASSAVIVTGNTTETPAPGSSSSSSGSEVPATGGSTTDSSAGSSTTSSTASSSGSSSGSSTGYEAPASSAPALSGSTGSSEYEAPATGSTGGEMTTPEGSTSGEMSASTPVTGSTTDQASAEGSWGGQTGSTEGQAAPAEGSWGGQSGSTQGQAAPAQGSWGGQTGGWGSAGKRDNCEVEYVGGAASRARRTVRA